MTSPHPLRPLVLGAASPSHLCLAISPPRSRMAGAPKTGTQGRRTRAWPATSLTSLRAARPQPATRPPQALPRVCEAQEPFHQHPPLPRPSQKALDAALDEAQRTLRDALVRHVRRQLPIDREGAIDAVQEAFLSAWLRRDRFRDLDHLRPWLYRVAYRKGIDWLRRRRTVVCDGELASEVSRLRPAPTSPKVSAPLDPWLTSAPEDPKAAPVSNDPPHGPSARRAPGSDAFRHVLRCGMARLRPMHSEVVRLHYLLGYDTAKVSRLLNLPRSTVKMRLFRARAALRAFVVEEAQSLAPAEQRALREHIAEAGGTPLFPEE